MDLQPGAVAQYRTGQQPHEQAADAVHDQGPPREAAPQRLDRPGADAIAQARAGRAAEHDEKIVEHEAM